jgi:hypothetical protein
MALAAVCYCIFTFISCQTRKPDFGVIAFYNPGDEQAHLSFVHEANRWFATMAEKHNFIYDSTGDWNLLNPENLSRYQVVLFLDARPDSARQRAAFQRFMENGGSWMGFHFAGFALTPSAFNQDWDWYHNGFLGSGQYKSNTWRPTSAILRVEDPMHPAVKNIPVTFTASPNEWYRWEYDIRNNKDIKILLSIDSTSFPLGTGPKLYEIWHSGYYPVAWTNINYKMVYFNMGHNDLDFENKTNKELSHTFGNEIQDQLILNALLWLGKGK